MKIKALVMGMFLALVMTLLAMSSGCTEQERARNYGGPATVKLSPGKKLVNATWKQDDLWLLVRNVKPGEGQESYQFKESSSFGIMEGTVTIQEQK